MRTAALFVVHDKGYIAEELQVGLRGFFYIVVSRSVGGFDDYLLTLFFFL